ncbi:MAG: nucleoside permease [Planctomycetota bacterium]|nr:nucleoside permease [Planctomycetota bacterium]
MDHSNTGNPNAAGGVGVVARLSVMMFLQFFVWGAWYVSMTGFMNRTDMGGLIPAAYSVGPIAAILSPFFLGLIADRYFPTERVLAVMMLLGGGILFAAPAVAEAYNPETDGSAFFHPYTLVLLGHMLCFMPTLGLTSSLSFHNLPNREKQFPLVRVWGTIGWIAGNIAVSFLPGKDQAAEQFYLAGVAAIALGLYSFTLPHTPPPARGSKPSVREILGLDSIALLAKPNYAVFMVCSFLLCIPLAGYYAFARNYVEAAGAVVNDSAVFTMSFGQMSEILFMLVMPLCFARLGVKWMLAIGMLAWVVRYGLFAGAWDGRVEWMILGGILLHGICYDFFFVTGMIYVDKAANPRIRSQAQGFLVLVTQGLGMFIGAQAFGRLVGHFTTDGPDGATVLAWKDIWLWPCVFAGVIMLVFIALFRERAASAAPQTGLEPPGPTR